MSYTREEWAHAVLASGGNVSPMQATVTWMAAWTCLETSGQPGAAFNLLNTTQDAPGSTWFNTFGTQGQYHVRNYVSFTQGTNINWLEINNGYYTVLASALRYNQVSVLYSSLVNAVDQELATWGTGHVQLEITRIARSPIIAGRLIEEFGGSLPMPPTTEPTPAQARAMEETWNALRLPGVRYTSGIAADWRARYLARNGGAPICPEYPSVNWAGEAISVQLFSNGDRYEYNEVSHTLKVWDADGKEL